jgi:hypothetical protein
MLFYSACGNRDGAYFYNNLNEAERYKEKNKVTFCLLSSLPFTQPSAEKPPFSILEI